MGRKRYADGALVGASSARAVTPHDVNEVLDGNSETFPRALYIGGAGNLTVDMADGDTDVAFLGVQQGQILDIQVSRVKATGTTATNIVALF